MSTGRDEPASARPSSLYDELRAVIREQHDALLATRAMIARWGILDGRFASALEQVDGAIASGQEWL